MLFSLYLPPPNDRCFCICYFSYATFSNRSQISLSSRKVYDKLITMTEKRSGCPSSLVSYGHFPTDRAQYQGKSAMFSNVRVHEDALNDAIKYAQKGCAVQMREMTLRDVIGRSYLIYTCTSHVRYSSVFITFCRSSKHTLLK